MKVSKDFYWGAATASYQVEGGIENNDWAQAAREDRVPICGIACDHYNRYESDFDIVKELGHNAHRFSVEWARIEPERGEFDHAAIEHYRLVLQALRKRGIEPFITLNHFTLPLWLTKDGGWLAKGVEDDFARFCAHVVKEFGDLCSYYTTINEPMVVASQGYFIGQFPPFKRVPFVGGLSLQDRGKGKKIPPKRSLWHFVQYFQVENAMARAHNAAYDAIKSVNPEADVSIVKHTVYFHDRSNKKTLRTRVMNWYWTYRFMNKVIKKCDSIGLNYYQHKLFNEKRDYLKTDMGWQVFPSGIEGALEILWHYKKPIYVSEAGVADADDDIRADYIRVQVASVLKAYSKGIDVRGHMYWSLLDNYEWALGFEKKFGLVEVNYETQERKVRPSAWEYKRLIEEYSEKESEA